MRGARTIPDKRFAVQFEQTRSIEQFIVAADSEAQVREAAERAIKSGLDRGWWIEEDDWRVYVYERRAEAEPDCGINEAGEIVSVQDL